MEQFNYPVEIYFCLRPTAGRILTSNELNIILVLHLIKITKLYTDKETDDGKRLSKYFLHFPYNLLALSQFKAIIYSCTD